MLGERIALVFYAKILRQIIGLIAVIFTSRLLGPEVMGVTSYAASFIMVFWFLADFALEPAHSKMLNENRDQAQCLGALILFKGILSILVVGVILVAVFFSRNHFQHPQQVQVILLWMLGNLIANIASIATHTFVARKEMAKSEVVEISQLFAHLILVVWISFAMQDQRATAPAVLGWSFIAANLFSLLIAGYLFRGVQIALPDKKLVWSYFRFAAPLVFIIVLTNINLHIDKLIIGSFIGHTEVGYYHGATRINRFLLFFSGSVQAVLVPTFFQYYARNDIAAMKALLLKAERYLSLIISGLVVVMILCAPAIVMIIFGPEFFPSIILLQIVAVAALQSTLGRPVSALLIILDKPKIIIGLQVFSMLGNVLLNLILVPDYLMGFKTAGLGAKGAAMATVSVGIVTIILAKLAVWKVTRIPSYWGIFKHFFAAIFTLSLFLSLQHIFQYGDILWILLPLHAIGATFCYLLLVWLMGEIKKEDVQYIIHRIRPKNVRSYVRNELGGETPGTTSKKEGTGKSDDMDAGLFS